MTSRTMRHGSWIGALLTLGVAALACACSSGCQQYRFSTAGDSALVAQYIFPQHARLDPSDSSRRFSSTATPALEEAKTTAAMNPHPPASPVETAILPKPATPVPMSAELTPPTLPETRPIGPRTSERPRFSPKQATQRDAAPFSVVSSQAQGLRSSGPGSLETLIPSLPETTSAEILSPYSSHAKSTPKAANASPEPSEIEGPTVLPIGFEKSETAGKRAPLVEALQCVLDNRHQEALRHLQTYDKETQEVLLRWLPVLTIFATKRLDQMTPQEVAIVNEQINGLASTLRPRTELVIDAMCYCESVKGFGMYTPLSRNHGFLAESRDRTGDFVQLYVEIRNFASEPTRDGQFETRMTSQIEIHDAKGDRVWKHEFKDPPRRTRSRLNDFCNNYCFTVPELEPGMYRLSLQVVDETVAETRRVQRKSIEFRVAGPSLRSPQ